MGNPKAFLTIPRKEAGYRPIQASRCMDCGVPFCHWACPLGNKAPEWNDALYKGDWELAYRLLNSTNDFPEFTGRICPALCEKACILNLMDHEPTTNREDECAIVEHAFSEDYVRVEIPERNGKTIAVIGAGPAGLVAANQLNHKGYKVTVFEARENAGGLLRYGIPNFMWFLQVRLLHATSRFQDASSRVFTSPSNCYLSRTASSQAWSSARTSSSTARARTFLSSVVAIRAATASELLIDRVARA